MLEKLKMTPLLKTKRQLRQDKIIIVCKKEWQGLFTTGYNLQSCYSDTFDICSSSYFIKHIDKFSGHTVLLIGSWDNDYDHILQNHSGRKFLFWPHPPLKSELSHSPSYGMGVEANQLEHIMSMVGWRGIEKVFVSDRGASLLHKNFEYMPVLVEEKISFEKADKVENSVGCFFEHTSKKNILSQMIAVNISGMDLYMNNSPMPDYIKSFIRTFDLKINKIDINYFKRERSNNFSHLSSMLVNLQVTPSDECTPSSVESFLCGTPCIYSPSSVLAGRDEELDKICLINRVDNTLSISKKIKELSEDKEKYERSLRLANEVIEDINIDNSKDVRNCISIMTTENEFSRELKGLSYRAEGRFESLFGLSKGDEIKYYQDVDRGFQIMKDKKVAICGIARDCEAPLRQIMIPQIEDLVSYFKEYFICVFENDSKISSGDDTAKVLMNWAESHPNKCHIVCEELEWERVGGTHTKRTNRLAIHRNKYLTYAYENLSDFDYMVVLDMDLKNGFSINGIAHSIKNIEDIENCSAMTANALMGRVKYYDAFAYRDVGNFGVYNRKVLDKARSNGNRQIGSELVQIGSGFNALAVYDMKKVCDTIDKEGPASGNQHSLQFGNLYGDDKNCEHIRFHAALDACGYSVWLNPSLVVHY